MWFGRILFKRAEKIEPVALITQHNSRNLPDIETLVRGSDPPLSQSTTLLRAVQQGQETPQEELLRAAQTNKQ